MLRHLAASALRDGCWQEQASADALRDDARAAVDPTVAALLERIADDEDRHAALAWEIVAWCLEEDPDLAPAIAREAEALRVTAGAAGARLAVRADLLLSGRRAAL
jgi:hypothetical protein